MTPSSIQMSAQKDWSSFTIFPPLIRRRSLCEAIKKVSRCTLNYSKYMKSDPDPWKLGVADSADLNSLNKDCSVVLQRIKKYTYEGRHPICTRLDVDSRAADEKHLRKCHIKGYKKIKPPKPQKAHSSLCLAFLGMHSDKEHMAL